MAPSFSDALAADRSNADERRAARQDAGAAAVHVPVARVFNGKFTIASPTGEHRTFDISTQSATANFAPGKRVVSLLVGPNNQTDYRGFGFIDDQGIGVWKSSRGTFEAPSFFDKCAAVLWSLATLGDASPWYARGMRLHVESTCVRCNRALTDPVSILTGIGPTCAGRE